MSWLSRRTWAPSSRLPPPRRPQETDPWPIGLSRTQSAELARAPRPEAVCRPSFLTQHLWATCPVCHRASGYSWLEHRQVPTWRIVLALQFARLACYRCKLSLLQSYCKRSQPTLCTQVHRRWPGEPKTRFCSPATSFGPSQSRAWSTPGLPFRTPWSELCPSQSFGRLTFWWICDATILESSHRERLHRSLPSQPDR